MCFLVSLVCFFSNIYVITQLKPSASAPLFSGCGLYSTDALFFLAVFRERYGSSATLDGCKQTCSSLTAFTPLRHSDL